jgi:hypothetical protein
MKLQEIAGKSELGTLLDIKMDWEEQEIEVAEPITTVTVSCSEIQENGSIKEYGLFDSEIIGNELIPGSIELDSWKKSMDVEGQDSPENQTPVETRESFPRDDSVQELPESQGEGGQENDEISADPRSMDLEQTESTRSNSIGEYSTESGNESMEIPAASDDCLPGPSKSSGAGEEIEETPILKSQKRKKSQEIRTDGISSDVQKRQSLARKCKKSNCETTDASEPETKKTSNPTLNEKPKKNQGTRITQKNQKSASGTKKLAGRKKYWECDRCGRKIVFKCDLIRHLQTHNVTNDFDCRICGQFFKTSNCRYKHEERHTASKAKCEICDKEYKNRQTLYDHRYYMHSDREKPACEICQKIFSTKNKLRSHEKRVHKLN